MLKYTLILFLPLIGYGRDDSLIVERFMTTSGAVTSVDSLWDPKSSIRLPFPNLHFNYLKGI
jgi:hypothetical protein